MNYCNRCKTEIPELELSEIEKLNLWYIEGMASKITYLKSRRQINLIAVKSFILHLNKEYGKCNRCDKEGLEGERINCPDCQSFNLNWEICPSFDESFCITLATYITRYFRLESKEVVNHYWCDGVSHLPVMIEQLSKQWVRENEYIETNAWIGKEGQEVYKLWIHFGKRSLIRYFEGKSIEDCLPNNPLEAQIEIDIKNKKIEMWME